MWYGTITGGEQGQEQAIEAQRGVLQADDEGRQRTVPRWGERAEHIRMLRDRYPTMKPSVIAEKVGCDPSNVTKVIQRYAKAVSVEELREFQAHKADVFDALQHRALASITEAHMQSASLQQLVTSAAILEDKARLVRGQATSIDVSVLLDVAEAMRQQRG